MADACPLDVEHAACKSNEYFVLENTRRIFFGNTRNSYKKLLCPSGSVSYGYGPKMHFYFPLGEERPRRPGHSWQRGVEDSPVFGIPS
jgi:hypothetical protein